MAGINYSSMGYTQEHVVKTVAERIWDFIEYRVERVCPPAGDAVYELTEATDGIALVKETVEEAVSGMLSGIAADISEKLLRRARSEASEEVREQMTLAMELYARTHCYGDEKETMLATAHWGDPDMPEKFLAAWAFERECATKTYIADWREQREREVMAVGV